MTESRVGITLPGPRPSSESPCLPLAAVAIPGDERRVASMVGAEPWQGEDTIGGTARLLDRSPRLGALRRWATDLAATTLARYDPLGNRTAWLGTIRAASRASVLAASSSSVRPVSSLTPASPAAVSQRLSVLRPLRAANSFTPASVILVRARSNSLSPLSGDSSWRAARPGGGVRCSARSWFVRGTSGDVSDRATITASSYDPSGTDRTRARPRGLR